MPGYGGVYVEVDASAVNGGIMTLSASGEIGEGDQTGTWWLYWQWGETGNGFTGRHWYWDGYSDNYLPTSWAIYCTTPPNLLPENTGKIYASTEEGFKQYLSENNIQELDTIFSGWPADMKASFAKIVQDDTGWYPEGCVDLR